jgi:hypothetical protein
MRIRDRQSAPACAAGLASLILLAWAAVAGAQVNRSLKILYAGRPGSDREKDFVAFLREHFDTVQTGDLKAFQETDTEGFDVTLLDWDWNESAFRRPGISTDFARPIITLGVPGGLICSQWSLKTGYM